MMRSVENEIIFPSVVERGLNGIQSRDLGMSICFKALAETLATVQAIYDGVLKLAYQARW